tara:strand:+ start:455 stop:1426 length:972 start_codon:yes stop_codon:yes gene_type:complete
MIIYGVDWSHKEEKIAIFHDGGLLNKEPDYKEGDIVATENMPHNKCVELHHKGVNIYRCNTDLTKKIRDEKGIEKTDDNDAKIIFEEFSKWSGHQSDETFRRFVYDVRLEALSYEVKVRSEAVEARKKSKQRTGLDPVLAELKADELKEATNYVSRCNTKIKKHLVDFPIYSECLKDIKGVGIASAGELVTIIKDIERFPTVSKLWAYFGLDVRNGKAPKRKKGELANWSQRGRSLILNDIVSNGFKMGGAATEKRPEPFKWRSVYDEFKSKELEKNELRAEEDQLSNGHMDNRAVRRTGKEFLKMVWNKWKALNQQNELQDN